MVYSTHKKGFYMKTFRELRESVTSEGITDIHRTRTELIRLERKIHLSRNQDEKLDLLATMIKEASMLK